MTFKSLAAGLCATAALSTGTVAFAQTAAPAAPPAVTHGAPIAGLCVVNLEQVVGGSTVGKFLQTRLQQIQQQANAEVSGENTALQNEAKALDAQRATLDQSTLEQRAAQIQVKGNALNRKVQTRERELQLTEQKAVGRVLQEAEQPVRQAYQQKGCAILIQHSAVLGIMFNPAMDITPQVVTALNAKLTQFAFDRERLDQPQAAASGGAPPIVQTPSTPRPAAPAKK